MLNIKSDVSSTIVLFSDPKELISKTLANDISRRLERYASQSRKKTNWRFYVVEGYSDHMYEHLEKQIPHHLDNTKTLIVSNNSFDKNTIKYLQLPINGIVSLSYLIRDHVTVLRSLETNEIFLEQDLHNYLSNELDAKKSYSKPIKQFILNKDKITIDLTDRDYEVLQLLLDGHSNSEIAGKMHFARSTVSTIISSLLKKMKASDRTDATVKTIRNGWVDCYR